MKEKTVNKMSYNILLLQNQIKRDPQSYYDEFYAQYEHYKSLLELFKLNPQEYNENVADLIMFFAQVSSLYKDDLKEFPNEIIQLLRDYGSIMDPSMRLGLCKALILMRNRGMLEPLELITLCFELLRCTDKILRKHLQIHIVTDLKNINAKHKNAKVNSALQNFMFKMLADRNKTAAKVSLDIMIELYKRNIWKDAKTVNAIATACFSKVNKILVAAHKFFLSVDEEDEEKEDSDSDEDDKPTVKEVMTANKFNKKSRKRMKLLKRTKQVLQKSKRKRNKEVFDFSAIHLLHDPQGMAEKLLKSVQDMNERYEIKLMVMNLISRLVGVHELILLNYYPLLVRYVKPHQREVTKILMFAAQAAHEQVPPDAIEPVVKAIAYNFITERNSAEVITVGINAVREICLRCPFAIGKDLLQDLVQYNRYKNKNVMMAARSLIQLFRKINPQMLQRKMRSKPTELSRQLIPAEFGVTNAKSYIPGTETLPLEPSDDIVEDEPVDETQDSDGWIDVSHSEDELVGNYDDDDDGEEEEEKVNDQECVKDDTEVSPTSEGAKESDTVSKLEKKPDSKEKTISKFDEEKEKAMAVSHSRILSQEEFRKLKVAQVAKEVQFAKGKKRKAEAALSEPEIKKNELVSLRDIEKLHKRPKADKESRLASVMEGREDRESFSKKRKKKSPHASKTHKEHSKGKAFMMIKHKLKSKVKRSFRDKQRSLKHAMLKRGKFK